MTSPSEVRFANKYDAMEVWRLFLQGYAENGIFQICPEKVEWWVKRLLYPEEILPWDMGPRGAIGVIGPRGFLEAICVLTIGEFWYSKEKHLEEFLVYVDPQHRRSEHAKALINWMKKQSEVTGLIVISGIMSNTRTEAKCRLYGRMLPKIGEFYYHVPKRNGHEKTKSI